MSSKKVIDLYNKKQDIVRKCVNDIDWAIDKDKAHGGHSEIWLSISEAVQSYAEVYSKENYSDLECKILDKLNELEAIMQDNSKKENYFQTLTYYNAKMFKEFIEKHIFSEELEEENSTGIMTHIDSECQESVGFDYE